MNTGSISSAKKPAACDFAADAAARAFPALSVAAATPAGSKGEEEIARERAELTDWRLKLIEEAERLQGETSKLQQERMQLALERRRGHEDLDLLRQQEENLRSYEKRLREMQGQLEADRVVWCSTNIKQASRSPFTDDAALREA